MAQTTMGTAVKRHVKPGEISSALRKIKQEEMVRFPVIWARFGTHAVESMNMPVSVVDKPWGREYVLSLDGKRASENAQIGATVLVFGNGQSTSYHFHNERHEFFYLLEGSAMIYTAGAVGEKRMGDAWNAQPKARHRIVCNGTGSAVIVEVHVPFRLEDQHSGIRSRFPDQPILLEEPAIFV